MLTTQNFQKVRYLDGNGNFQIEEIELSKGIAALDARVLELKEKGCTEIHLSKVISK